MAHSINTQLDGDIKDRFQEYLDDQSDDISAYKASRDLIDEGLRRHGYHPSEDGPKNQLQRFISHLVSGFAIAGLILLGMSVTGHPGVQTFTAVVFAIAIVLEAANRLGEKHLDGVASWMRSEVTGGE